VMFKMREGVPYEASIFFGGDGIKLEEVPEGATLTVNGRAFQGPGVVIREWPLRGIAICPYGADQNTESAALSSGETVAATLVPPTQTPIEPKETSEMHAEQKTVEAEAVAEGVAPVEAAAVEAKVETEQTASEAADGAVGRIAGLTAERDALATERDALRASIDASATEAAKLKADIATAGAALAQTTAERDALKADRDEACRKLAAIEAGAPPLSATPAPETQPESAWKRAQKTARRQ